jgi:hypothetical protein
VNSIGLTAGEFKEKKKSVVDGFELSKINANLLENGYDSETEYIYENKDGKKYTIAEKFITFISPTVYSNFKTLESEYKSSSSFKCLYFVNENPKSNTRIFYLIGCYFGEIKGDMSAYEALNILQVRYREKYKSIFGE